MKKVILFFAVAAFFVACAPKAAETTEEVVDTVAVEQVTEAPAVDSTAVEAPATEEAPAVQQ